MFMLLRKPNGVRFYSPGARRVIFLAREEAMRYGSPYIESEHLLLGVLRENEAVVTRIAGTTVSFAELGAEIEAKTTCERGN
jgi:ATP-dependent Clp protease ATP-binding subunit ClpC